MLQQILNVVVLLGVVLLCLYHPKLLADHRELIFDAVTKRVWFFSIDTFVDAIHSSLRNVWCRLEYSLSEGIVWCLKYCAQGIILGLTLATLASVPWMVLLGWWRYERDRI